jgi:hypothetical protein
MLMGVPFRGACGYKNMLSGFIAESPAMIRKKSLKMRSCK